MSYGTLRMSCAVIKLSLHPHRSNHLKIKPQNGSYTIFTVVLGITHTHTHLSRKQPVFVAAALKCPHCLTFISFSHPPLPPFSIFFF